MISRGREVKIGHLMTRLYGIPLSSENLLLMPTGHPWVVGTGLCFDFDGRFFKIMFSFLREKEYRRDVKETVSVHELNCLSYCAIFLLL